MTAASPDALLFPGRDGVSHLQPSTLHRNWRMAREAAGRPDLRVHDLRHTGATMAARAGATLAELQQRLGHSSVSAALRYQHAAQGVTRRSPQPSPRWLPARASSYERCSPQRTRLLAGGRPLARPPVERRANLSRRVRLQSRHPGRLHDRPRPAPVHRALWENPGRQSTTSTDSQRSPSLREQFLDQRAADTQMRVPGSQVARPTFQVLPHAAPLTCTHRRPGVLGIERMNLWPRHGANGSFPHRLGRSGPTQTCTTAASSIILAASRFTLRRKACAGENPQPGCQWPVLGHRWWPSRSPHSSRVVQFVVGRPPVRFRAWSIR
ncbi:MAG: tyrosine-type recombinase/integrase [Nostocoides sp.]